MINLENTNKISSRNNQNRLVTTEEIEELHAKMVPGQFHQ